MLFRGSEPDAGLVARTRKGDVEAFNLLVSRWEKRLYNYLLRLLGGQPGYREDSLDLCQEAFLKAYQNLASLEDPEKFPQWLFRIAHNLAYSQLRRPARMEESEAGREAEWAEGTQDGWEEWKDARTFSRQGAARAVFGLELECSVAKALDALAPEQREAIVLKVYHGFCFEEIAAIAACPVSTVKSRIYAGFAHLRKMLAAEPARSTLRQAR